MSLRCLLGRHAPLLNSILQTENGFRAVCERCACAIERPADGRWQVAKLLTVPSSNRG